MANVIGFAIDLSINVAVLAEAFGAQSSGPVVKIGTGSLALPGTVPPPSPIPNNEQPAGPMPGIDLYDVHGQNFATDTAFGEEMTNSDNKQVNFQGGLDKSNLDSTPEYSRHIVPHLQLKIQKKISLQEGTVRLIALQDDAVCISWVTATGTDGTHTSWHAGYAQQCNVPAWYPSPDLFPSTNYRPGCVWLTNDVNFPGLQAISFKLTDLSFQSDADTTAALSQFSSDPDTLCLAPGRMAFWKTADPEDCIPFYDFVEEKDPTTGFDVDFGKIMTGQTMTCKPTGSMYTPSNFPPQTQTPTTTAAPPPPPSTTDGAGSFGGIVGEIPASDTGPQITQAPSSAPPSTTDGAGSFGGIVGEIPADEAGLQITQAPSSPPPTQTAQPPVQTFNGNAGDQGAVALNFNPGGPAGTSEAIPPEQTITASSKAKSRRRSIDHTSILERRANLEKKRDFCVDRLTISHLSDHSATVVCQSETSWGPDFVSVVEGLYCDMCEKMLWNLCTGPGATYCFDLVARELRFSGDLETRGLGEGMTGEEELVGLRKRYAKVDEWKE